MITMPAPPVGPPVLSYSGDITYMPYIYRVPKKTRLA